MVPHDRTMNANIEDVRSTIRDDSVASPVCRVNGELDADLDSVIDCDDTSPECCDAPVLTSNAIATRENSPHVYEVPPSHGEYGAAEKRFHESSPAACDRLEM